MNKNSFRVAIAKRGFTQNKVAELSGVQNTNICAAFNGRQSLSLESIKRISTAINLSPEEVWSIFFTDELA